MATESIDAVGAEVLKEGTIRKPMVDRIRQRVYGSDGKVGKAEAEFLFKIQEATAQAQNDPAWPELFADAVTNHLLKQSGPPYILDSISATNLVKKLGKGDRVSPAHITLLGKIVTTANATTPHFHEYVFDMVERYISTKGVVEADDAKLISDVIYGSGGSSHHMVDRPEANFMFTLKNATAGKKNHESWKNVFLEAIGKHLLEDETSPDEIDDFECEWLEQMFEGRAKLDEYDIALIKSLKSHLKTVTGPFKRLLDRVERKA
jgi:hypothetical protein